MFAQESSVSMPGKNYSTCGPAGWDADTKIVESLLRKIRNRS